MFFCDYGDVSFSLSVVFRKSVSFYRRIIFVVCQIGPIVYHNFLDIEVSFIRVTTVQKDSQTGSASDANSIKIKAPTEKIILG